MVSSALAHCLSSPVEDDNTTDQASLDQHDESAVQTATHTSARFNLAKFSAFVTGKSANLSEHNSRHRASPQLEERTASRKQSMRDQHLAAAQSLKLDHGIQSAESSSSAVRPSGEQLILSSAGVPERSDNDLPRSRSAEPPRRSRSLGSSFKRSSSQPAGLTAARLARRATREHSTLAPRSAIQWQPAPQEVATAPSRLVAGNENVRPNLPAQLAAEEEASSSASYYVPRSRSRPRAAAQLNSSDRADRQDYLPANSRGNVGAFALPSERVQPSFIPRDATEGRSEPGYAQQDSLPVASSRPAFQPPPTSQPEAQALDDALAIIDQAMESNFAHQDSASSVPFSQPSQPPSHPSQQIPLDDDMIMRAAHAAGFSFQASSNPEPVPQDELPEAAAATATIKPRSSADQSSAPALQAVPEDRPSAFNRRGHPQPFVRTLPARSSGANPLLGEASSGDEASSHQEPQQAEEDPVSGTLQDAAWSRVPVQSSAAPTIAAEGGVLMDDSMDGDSHPGRLSFGLSTGSIDLGDPPHDGGMRQLWQELKELCSRPRGQRDPAAMARYLDLKLNLAGQQLSAAGSKPLNSEPETPLKTEELPSAAHRRGASPPGRRPAKKRLSFQRDWLHSSSCRLQSDPPQRRATLPDAPSSPPAIQPATRQRRTGIASIESSEAQQQMPAQGYYAYLNGNAGWGNGDQEPPEGADANVSSTRFTPVPHPGWQAMVKGHRAAKRAGVRPSSPVSARVIAPSSPHSARDAARHGSQLY
ncbi:hypothetical protein WJX73_001779 [Symbiochloris irregularis]|uniref:Uncharacterized protein n=1 Tax=Symbiochloris irregularis TaxID=706552 RepID=A0AAW1NK23_9CHLO